MKLKFEYLDEYEQLSLLERIKQIDDEELVKAFRKVLSDIEEMKKRWSIKVH